MLAKIGWQLIFYVIRNRDGSNVAPKVGAADSAGGWWNLVLCANKRLVSHIRV